MAIHVDILLQFHPYSARYDRYICLYFRFITLALLGRRGTVVACACLSIRPSVRKRYLVRTTTRHRLELESPNLHITFIIGYSQFVLKNRGH